MSQPVCSLAYQERLISSLRQLYDAHGFRNTKVSHFEEYTLYMDNQNFLNTQRMITFMDLSGKLMALKPDVTLSIVKNIPAEHFPSCEKLYYVDAVYRLCEESASYQLNQQIGVELIGPIDTITTLETLGLAIDSLERIASVCVLDLSHLGFLGEMLEQTGMDRPTQIIALSYIHAKNTHDLETFLQRNQVAQPHQTDLLALATIQGELHLALDTLRSLVRNDTMAAIYQELCTLNQVLRASHPTTKVNLDFSVVNDLDYYTGLIFRGYVKGCAKPILSGGRYDSLLKKMGKASGAIGFAISLHEQLLAQHDDASTQVDLLLTYPADCDPTLLMKTVQQLRLDSNRVRLEREDVPRNTLGYSFAKHINYHEIANPPKKETTPC